MSCLETLGAMAQYGQSSPLPAKAISAHPQAPALEKVLLPFESFLLTISLYHRVFRKLDRYFLLLLNLIPKLGALCFPYLSFCPWCKFLLKATFTLPTVRLKYS